MPRGSRFIIKHRLEEFDERLIDGYTQLYKNATIAYVKAAMRTIPILTGQARASFAAAAQSLGLDVSIDGPPISQGNRQKMLKAGNTAARGYGLGKATIKVDRSSARWNYRNWLTSAHNGFPYLDKQWNSFSVGRAAFKAYIQAHEDTMINQIIRESI